MSVSTGATSPTKVMARGAVMTFAGHAASLARPIALAWFARLYGAGALGGFVVIWTGIELGSRFATLGLDRGLQRWPDDKRASAAVARATAAIAGIAIAGAAGLALAVALVAAMPLAGLDDVSTAARVALLVGLPLTAMSNVALRAARCEAQIAGYVLARGVTEPLLLLLVGLVLSSGRDGSVALPAALVISIAGGAAVAAWTLVRALGARPLVHALLRVRNWPVRALLRSSLPLGLADLLQAAQAKLDLVAVAIVTLSPPAIAAYAIAAEIASVFTVMRTGFDQVVAPVAVDLRDQPNRLAEVLTTATRWSVVLAVPIAILLLAAPGAFLALLGGVEDSALVLMILVIGRGGEMILGPATSMLVMVGRPALPLRAAAAGVALAVAGQIAAGVVGLGPVGIAIASSAGVLTSGGLALRWLRIQNSLARLSRCHDGDAGLPRAA